MSDLDFYSLPQTNFPREPESHCSTPFEAHALWRTLPEAVFAAICLEDICFRWRAWGGATFRLLASQGAVYFPPELNMLSRRIAGLRQRAQDRAYKEVASWLIEGLAHLETDLAIRIGSQAYWTPYGRRRKMRTDKIYYPTPRLLEYLSMSED